MHCINASKSSGQNSKFQIPDFNATCPILLAQTKIVGLRNLKDSSAKSQGDESKIQNLKSKIGLAFCALGNPENSFESLRYENFDIRAVKSFTDHYAYTQTDVEKTENEARAAGGEILLTTAKNAVKLQNLNRPRFDKPNPIFT